MNKKSISIMLVVAMIFSLFTGINMGTENIKAAEKNGSLVMPASGWAINVSGKKDGSESEESFSASYKEYGMNDITQSTDAVTEAAFTVVKESEAATEAAIAYYIEEIEESTISSGYKVKTLEELEGINEKWVDYDKDNENRVSLSVYAGKIVVIYAKFVEESGDNTYYLHSEAIKIAASGEETLPTTSPAVSTPTPPAVSTPPTTSPDNTPTPTPPDNTPTPPDNTPTPTPTQTPTQTPTTEPTQTPTTEPTQTPTTEPTQTPTTEPTQTPTTEPTQTPTQTPTTEPTQTPTTEPTQTPTQTPTETPIQTPTQIPTETPTQTPTETPIQTPTAEPTIEPDKKLSVNYDDSEKFVKSSASLNLKVTVKTDVECSYKWYKKGNDKTLSSSKSYKVPKNTKAGTYTYICEVKADGYKTEICKFTVTVYKDTITIPWGDSASAKDIFGKSRKIKKITIPAKYKSYLSANAKTGKISVNKYFSGKAVIKYVVGKKTLSITVKSKIPEINYTAWYSKKKQQLEIKLDSFTMKNLNRVYIMAKGTKWNSKCYKLIKLPYKKKKNIVIITGFTKTVRKCEMKFLLNTSSDTYKAWKNNEKSKKNIVKQK